ncbi:futalosine hydrolase [Paenibacillus anaericanus]|uniref:Futalosine hydrolase n=1 Tax=Paenibacillus anaericanus TaxID=170367 RepID=A0A433YCB1_9BACL|nr:futalosine hydrolase [Paenibacillus anaericanus]RUT47488.1 futalosine hydrolase [Paenibacillus anaericanus]
MREETSIDSRYPQVLIMTAVQGEKDAVLRGLGGATGFDVCLAGVGPASAAARTAAALACGKYDLVISAGIGGGFRERADVGSLVIASEIIAADLGVETAEGFASVDELGFGSARVTVHPHLPHKMLQLLESSGIPACIGPVVTLSTATGTASTTTELARRIPGVAAEAMEGYGVAIAAQQLELPVIEIRAISNVVGPRQRDLWKIDDAMKTLERAFAKLPEVLHK